MANRSKNISESVAERIKKLRISRGYTQKELSELLYKSESTVRMWELGKSEPDLSTLQRLSVILGVSVDYLLDTEEKPAENGELLENTIIYHRDGKTERKQLTKEQMDMIAAMLATLPDTPKDI